MLVIYQKYIANWWKSSISLHDVLGIFPFQTNVAQILIAVNPYQAIDELYSQAIVEKYLNTNQNDLEPHIFSIGNYTI